MNRAELFTEGDADVKFLQDYLVHLGVEGIKVTAIGGKDKIHLSRPQFENNRKLNVSNVLILDSDTDFQKRKLEVELNQIIQEFKIPCFLFPNNKENGDLETLLEQIIYSQNNHIFDCWNQYETCLSKVSDAATPSGRFILPNKKAKIFAYLEALGTKAQQIKESGRNYLNSVHWDLDSPALEPLKKFIQNI